MRTGWVSSDCHFDLEMRIRWHSIRLSFEKKLTTEWAAHPVVIWKKIQPDGLLIWLSIFFKWQPDGVAIRFSLISIRTIVVLKFFIRVQEDRIRVQEELVHNEGNYLLGWVLSNWGPKPNRPNPNLGQQMKPFLKGCCCLYLPSLIFLKL